MVAAATWLGASAALATSTPIAAPAPVEVQPVLRVAPARVRPGDALLITLEGVPGSVASSTSGTIRPATPAPGRASAEPATRRLRFFPAAAGVQAVASLPVEASPGKLEVEVRLPDRGATLTAAVEVVDPGFPEAQLSVEPKFISPSPEQKKRMEEDQAAFREAFARPFEPPIFASAFTRPRDSNVTGAFGEKRMFNGKKQSQHYGTDLAGAVGEPVRVTNDGVVVLARDCFASGKSIAVAHGAGVFSVYFHLSDIDVRHGDVVRQGQVIGKVGATGRVTGPHLHFGIKVNDLYVDPNSVYRLTFATSGTGPGGTGPTSGTGPGTGPGPGTAPSPTRP